MADAAVSVVAGSAGVVLRYGPIVAVAYGVDPAALPTLRERVRAAARADDPAAMLVAGLQSSAAASAFAAVVSTARGLDAVVLGDVDVHAETVLGVAHLNARAASGPVRDPLPGTVSRVRLGRVDADVADGFDLEAGVVPGEGAVVVLSAVSPQGAPPAPAVRAADNTAPPASRVPTVPPADAPGAPVAQPASAGSAPAADEPFEAVVLTGARKARVDPALARPPLPVARRDAPAADPTAAATPVGERVLGINCGRGHFNHPEAVNCAWCGLAMLQVSRALVEGPRPPLGVLMIDEQASFTLDADYVIGRQPRHDPSVNGDTVRELVLNDPDRSVSRVHAKIRLDGWNVVVEDTGSANGTWLLAPDRRQYQQRLPPHTPRVLRPGQHLQIGRHLLSFYSHHLR